MDRIALYTRLWPGEERAYAEFHRRVPQEIVDDLLARGVHDWQVWRRGQDLFHLVTVEDFQHFVDTPPTNETARDWGSVMSRFLQINNDFNAMAPIWALADQLAEQVDGDVTDGH